MTDRPFDDVVPETRGGFKTKTVKPGANLAGTKSVHTDEAAFEYLRTKEYLSLSGIITEARLMVSQWHFGCFSHE